MPRARCRSGNISAAAARESWIDRAGRADEREPERDDGGRRQRAAARDDAAARSRRPTKPPRITGIRPTRSISAAGRADGEPAGGEEDRRPEAEEPVIPVTATSVSDDSAAASWNMPELQTSRRGEQERVACVRAGVTYGAHAPSLRSSPSANATRAAVRRMPDVRSVERLRGEPPDGDDAAAARQLVEERPGGATSRRVGRRLDEARAGMRRHDVPEQDVVLDPELREHAVDDRRGRLGGAAPGQLPLGGERDAADAGAAVAGRLADEQDRRVRARREMLARPARAAAPTPRTGCASRRCARARAGRRDPVHAGIVGTGSCASG